MTKTATVKIPERLGFLFDPPLGQTRYRVAYGGRGGGKSWSVARALLVLGYQHKLRILCTREYQSSIRDSVHRVLQDQAIEIGLGDAYEFERSRIYGHNGTEFLFYGIKRDPHSIKSLEGVDICWPEEAEAISEESWSILIPTIRKPGSEIWVTFNPALPDDPTYQRFVVNPPGNAIIEKIGYRDNPWLPDVLKAEADDLKRRDPEAYAHVWGGEPWMRSDSQVLAGRWRVEEFEPTEAWGEPLFGADWGFARDPTVLVKLWIWDNRLWVEYDERGTEWSMEEIDRRFRRVPDADRYEIPGDSSRPETINELQRLGLRVVAAPKWPGSVEDGVEHLRGYEEIIVHPRCKGMIEDFRMWRYKTDTRTDAVLPKLQDGHDHGPDAIRYALSRMIRKHAAPSFRTF